MAKVTKLKIEEQNGTAGGTVFATWSFGKKNLDHYKVTWYYATGDGIWFNAGSSDITIKQSTYSVPSNAVSVKVSVKPVSKKRKVKGKQKPYWSGTSVSKEWSVSKSTPAKPSAPTVTIDKYKLTAYIDLVNSNISDRVEFVVINERNAIVATSGSEHVIVNATANRATFTANVTAGGIYRVKCRIHNLNTNKKVIATGEWSDFSQEVKTIPAAVTNVKCEAKSKTSIRVSWSLSASADSYEVEYTDVKGYFNSNPNATTKVTSETDHAEIIGLESGKRYYFRVRAINAQGESSWKPDYANIVSCIIGTKPEAPTTWSLSTTVMVGEDATLYWTHNSEDGSKLTDAEIELKVGNTTTRLVYTEQLKKLGLANPADKEDETDAGVVYYLPIDLSSYKDSDEILWRVRTKGITNEYSDWSIQRSITVYAPPTLSLTLGGDASATDIMLNQLPFTIEANPGPDTQKPISYHIAVVANNSYEVEDGIGRVTYITAGTEVYSKIFNVSDDPLSVELLPGNISLANNESYTVKATVSMNSGLRATAERELTVEWGDETYEPDASIFEPDMEGLTISLTPFCYDPVESEDEEEVLTENVTLSVYRREYDGSFTELATGIENDLMTTITDRFPSLDYARYRIVAQNKTTGAIGYSDLPGEPIGESSIVIQWDDDWIPFDTSPDEPDALETPTWVGSMLRLPYNVDIDEKYDPDVSLVEYIGREHPVGYYGTQKGESMMLSAEFDKEDSETILAIRRLAKWPGDVYVREPSGIGYWAHVKVSSMPIKHKELTIQVAFDVTRVEGGKE